MMRPRRKDGLLLGTDKKYRDMKQRNGQHSSLKLLHRSDTEDQVERGRASRNQCTVAVPFRGLTAQD
ncbi:unnamed protein product [Gongylonema pulchrum]|uniref:Uncharacterized protein n=1 Tax=Gongylonema pulchrum TaxID=637853 RepID=A0A183DNF2_9BILA|nr:unnamed protein product [Gongylonema pulchrum]